jgi:hypothetical protein
MERHMTIIDNARALMALMQPLTGSRSTGSITVRSTGATGTLPANAHAAPIIGGVLRPELLVKTAVNTDDSPTALPGHAWPITRAGTTVPVLSVLGGLCHDFPAGTVLRWLPEIDSIEPTAEITVGMTGGTANTSHVGVAEVRLYEQLTATAPGIEVFKAAFSRFPGVMLTWQSSVPDDGQGEQPLGRRESRLGRGKTLLRNVWDIFVACSRMDSDPARREQGLDILDELTETMIDRATVDGMRFSSVRGLSVHQRARWNVSPSLYVYLLRVSTTDVAEKREHRNFAPWLRTRLDVDTPDEAPFPLVHDNRFNMPQE